MSVLREFFKENPELEEHRGKITTLITDVILPKTEQLPVFDEGDKFVFLNTVHVLRQGQILVPGQGNYWYKKDDVKDK